MSKTSNAQARPLTKTQLEYAGGRLRQIERDKIAKWEHANPQPKSPDMDWDEKMRLIRSGKAKLAETVGKYDRVGEAFEYPLSAEQKAAKAAHALWTKARAKFVDDIDAKKSKILDQLYLADAAAALAAIEQFAAE